MKGIMRTSGEIDFRFRLKLKITLVDSTYPSQRPQCPSLSHHFLLVKHVYLFVLVSNYYFIHYTFPLKLSGHKMQTSIIVAEKLSSTEPLGFPYFFLPSCRHLCRAFCRVFCRVFLVTFFVDFFGHFFFVDFFAHFLTTFWRLFCRLFVDILLKTFVECYAAFVNLSEWV